MSYTCCSKSLLIRSKKNKAAGILSLYCGRGIGPAACAVCRERRNRRIMADVRLHFDIDGDLFWRVVIKEEARRILVNLRELVWGWYMRLPQPDNQAAIIANDNTRLQGAPLPDDPLICETLITRLAENTPKGCRVSSKRDGRQKLERSDGWDTYKIDAPSHSVAAYLVESGAKFKQRKGDMQWFEADENAQEATLAALGATDDDTDLMPSGRPLTIGNY